MNAPSEDIKDMLVSESSLGLTYATNLFIGILPDNPEECVAIIDLPGDAPKMDLKKSTSKYYKPSVLIKNRKLSYTAAYEQMFDIMNFLHGEGNLTVNGTFYSIIKAKSDPQLLQWDENNRPIFIINFDVQRR